MTLNRNSPVLCMGNAFIFVQVLNKPRPLVEGDRIIQMKCQET